MKNNSKRICALLLAIVMCIGCVVPVFAESTGAHTHAAAVCPGADEEHTMTNCTTVFVKTVPAECGKLGYDLYECTTCHTPVVTNWQEIGDGNHAWGEWTQTKAPTCDEFGEETRYCTNKDCEGKETRPVAKRQHVMTNDKDESKECKDGIPAWKEWCTYADCDHEVQHTATPGTACDRYVAEIVKAPNCYELGTAVVKCNKCSYEAKEVIVLATGSLAHTWDTSKTVVSTAPTCGTAGSGTVYCSVCQKTVDVVNNKITIEYVTASGVKATDEITLPASFGFAATGIHSFTVDVPGSAADCDSTGIKDHKKCATCNAVSLDGVTVATDAELVIPALDHTWTDVDAVLHDCDNDGVLAHHKCSVCGALSFDKVVIVEASAVVDPAQCDYDLTTPVATSLPSCTKYGFWFYGCGVCGMPAEVEDGSTTNAAIPSTAPAGSEWVSNGVLRLPKAPHVPVLDPTDSRNQAGDCVNPEVKVYKCSNGCGWEEIVTGTVTGHAWETVTVKANCQHGGYKFDYCKSTICGWTDTNGDGIVDITECVTVKVGTATEEDATKDNPTVDGKYDVVPSQPNVHEWDPAKTVITTAPTCTDKGVALDWCVFCGASESHSIDALGHNSYKYVETVGATCNEGGWLVYKCSRCEADNTKVNLAPSELTADHENYATNSALDLGALGHDYTGVTPVHTAPTCSDYGYDVYACSRGCGQTKTEIFVTGSATEYLYPALNHTYPVGHAQAGQSSLYEYEKLPTCDATSTDPKVGIAGSITEKCYQCAHERLIETLEFVHDNALHHPGSVLNPDTVWHNGVEYPDAAAADAAAGGTANGIYWPGSCDRPKLVDYSCPNCGKNFYAADYSMVGDHSPKAGTEVAYSAPQCTTDGNLAHYVCEKCNAKVLINDASEKVVYTNDSAVVIPKTGHTWTDVPGTAPTCTGTGTKSYSYCACGAYTLDKTADPLEIFTVSELNDKIALPANSHAWGTIIPEVPAKCDEAGTKAYYDCANCDAVSLDATTVCTAAELVIPAINHVGYMVDSQLVLATCLTAGYQYHYCTLCDYEYVDNYVYAKGHVFGAQVSKVDADCDDTGFEAYYLCSVCNCKFVTNEMFDANAKSDTELTIPATGIHTNIAGGTILDKCTDAAEDRYCTGCNQDIPATHTSLETNDVEASCTEYGYTVEYCKDCGHEKVTKKTEWAPTGHNYQWVVTTPAQMYVGGVESYKCVAGNGSKGCGDVKDTRPTAPTGGIEFSYELDNAIVSGAEYVNGGRVKLTIKYKAANVSLASVALRLNFDASVLEYVSGDFKCGAIDPATELRIFDINNAEINGNAGWVVVKAKTFGFGEAPVDKTLNGEGIFAEIYFNINKTVDDGAKIDFAVAKTGLSLSQVLKADSSVVAANFGAEDADGKVIAAETVSLGDIDIDDNYTSADELEFLDIAFSKNYVAAADINQDGIIGLDDYGLLQDLLLGNKTYEEMCAAAQAAPVA